MVISSNSPRSFLEVDFIVILPFIKLVSTHVICNRIFPDSLGFKLIFKVLRFALHPSETFMIFTSTISVKSPRFLMIKGTCRVSFFFTRNFFSLVSIPTL